MNAAELFLEIRKALGLNQAAFAEIFGKGQSWTTKVETGRNVGLDESLEVFRILVLQHNINPMYLLLGEGPIFGQQQTKAPINESGSLLDRIKHIEDILGISGQEQP